MVRYFDKLFKNIWFTEFGAVNIFELNFEFHLCINLKLKGKMPFEFTGLGGKANWAGPAGLCSRARRLPAGPTRQWVLTHLNRYAMWSVRLGDDRTAESHLHRGTVSGERQP